MAHHQHMRERGARRFQLVGAVRRRACVVSVCPCLPGSRAQAVEEQAAAQQRVGDCHPRHVAVLIERAAACQASSGPWAMVHHPLSAGVGKVAEDPRLPPPSLSCPCPARPPAAQGLKAPPCCCPWTGTKIQRFTRRRIQSSRSGVCPSISTWKMITRRSWKARSLQHSHRSTEC